MNIEDFKLLKEKKIIFWYGELEEIKNLRKISGAWFFYSGRPARHDDYKVEDDCIHVVFPGYGFKKEFYEMFKKYIEI